MLQQVSANNTIFVDIMRNIQDNILNFLDKSDDNEENYQIITDIFEYQKINENIQKIKLVLKLLLKIAKNHHHETDFYAKIFKIILYFENQIVNYFSNMEIFNIFKNNKRILLFLFKKKMIIFNEFICKQLTTEKFIKAPILLNTNKVKLQSKTTINSSGVKAIYDTLQKVYHSILIFGFLSLINILFKN